MKLLVLALGLIMLDGCAMQLPHVPELGFNWESAQGKSREQLYEDQVVCRREVKLIYSRDLTDPGGTGLGLSEMRAFDDCMRSKGWVKK